MELSYKEFLCFAITSGHYFRRAPWMVEDLGRISFFEVLFDQRSAVFKTALRW